MALRNLFFLLMLVLIQISCGKNQTEKLKEKLDVSQSGWVSSGGELFGFNKNPWFLRNTSEVKYCIKVDSGTFTATAEVVRESLKGALEYWKKQLAAPKLEIGVTEIATQNFTEVSDCQNTDLQFLFGYNSLNLEQRNFLADSQKYIGVTVRTEYDRSNLLGRGFIFIASDSGPNSYQNNGQLIQKAWAYPKLLQYALMHELGHVFGIPHSGSGLMSEIFLDQLLYRRLFEFYLNNPYLSTVVPPDSFETCSDSGTFNQKFFKLQKPTACLRFERQAGANVVWKVLAKEKAQSPHEEIGSLHTTWATDRISASKPAVIVQLPPEQKVFAATEVLLNNYLIGPIITDVSYKGFFRTLESAKPYDAYIDLKVDSVSIIGNLEDGLFPVFVYVVPTLTNLILPTKFLGSRDY